MYVEKITISGFRNLNVPVEFYFTNDKNLIYGPNGSGKTSVLEAIYILGFGKSFLNVKKKELVNIGSSGFNLNSTILRDGFDYNVTAEFSKKFRLCVNGEKTDIAGAGRNIFPLFFSSNDYTSLISSRSQLRKLFDRFIFGTDILYSGELIEYKKIIRQKIFLLKFNPEISQIKGWNKLLSEYIFKITKRRIGFVKLLNKIVQENYCKGINLKYSPSNERFFHVDTFDKNEVYKILEENMNKEIKYKSILIGSHLDVYEIFLDNRPLRLYSSGEKKLNFFYLYLAYIDIFLSVRKEYPVFLVDDYDVAMDDSNTGILIEKYPSMQVIATSVRNNKNFNTVLSL